MKHLSSLQMSMYVDNALTREEHAECDQHVQACALCRAQLSAAEQDLELIGSALAIEPAPASVSAPPIKFKKSVSLGSFALANLATGLTIWLAQFLWKTLFGEVVVNTAVWLTSVYLPDSYALASATTLYLLKEGTAVFDTYLVSILYAVLFAVPLVAVVWFVLKQKNRFGGHVSVGLALSMATTTLLIGSLALPQPAQALVLMRDENLATVPAGEIVDDTLMVAADKVLIAGDVTGDLLVAGRHIDISGNVSGNLITFGEEITIRGEVGGFMLGAGSLYELRGAQVQGDMWAAGERVNVHSGADIDGNAAIASQTASVEGDIGRDFYAFAETVDLRGTVGEDLEAFAAKVHLLGNARVQGDVRYRSEAEENLHQDDSVLIAGAVEFLGVPEDFEQEEHDGVLGYVLWRFAGFISAFVTGLVIFWLIPGLRELAIGAGVEGLKTAGIGLFTLFVVPLLALVVAFTLIGIPLSAMAFVAWLVALYLAKIVVSAVLGEMMLGYERGIAMRLFAGLALVTLVTMIPILGGVVSFILTLLGLGLIVQYLFDVVSDRDDGGYVPGA